MNKSLLISMMVLGAVAAQAQINFTGSYSENFDSLPNSGSNPLTWTNNSTLAGWYSNRTLIRHDVGGLNTGSLYSYGAQDSTERALGAISSGTARPIMFGVRLTNMTGSAISAIDVSFVGEQWRAGGSTSTPLPQTTFFSYSLSATNIGTDTQTAAGIGGYTPDANYTAVAALDFTSPQFPSAGGALNGNDPVNQANLAATINLGSWNHGQDLWLRWVDIDDVGNDHGLAIDNLQVTAVPEPATLAALGLGASALMARRRRNRR